MEKRRPQERVSDLHAVDCMTVKKVAVEEEPDCKLTPCKVNYLY